MLKPWAKQTLKRSLQKEEHRKGNLVSFYLMTTTFPLFKLSLNSNCSFIILRNTQQQNLAFTLLPCSLECTLATDMFDTVRQLITSTRWNILYGYVCSCSVWTVSSILFRLDEVLEYQCFNTIRHEQLTPNTSTRTQHNLVHLCKVQKGMSHILTCFLKGSDPCLKYSI